MDPQWDMVRLRRPPQTYPAPGYEAEGLTGLFYDSIPWRGAGTRVFTWLGVPRTRGKIPGIVLIHGGGGTAFSDWIRLWNSRGYAAIAMDTCGGVPCWTEHPHFMNPWPRHAHSGPAGWSCQGVAEPVTDQWPYHAIAAVVLANSLLRSLPNVDPRNVGVTGVSWGGVLACIAAGVDSRFRFAVPVYGCGFLGDPPGYLLNPDQANAREWATTWDPSRFLGRARMPMLWVNGTNDGAFPMPALQKSYRLASGPQTLSIRVRMPHGHGGAGERPEEIRVFADSLTQGGVPLPRIRALGRSGHTISATYLARIPPVRAELNYTRALGYWTDRQWTTVPAQLDTKRCRMTASLPAQATVAYLNLIDDRGLMTSTEHVEIRKG